MSEDRIVSDQADEQDGIESSKNKELALTRRDFLHKTMAVTSALAIVRCCHPSSRTLGQKRCLLLP